MKGVANACLGVPNFSTLRIRLENGHVAVEAATKEVKRGVRLNEGRGDDGEAASLDSRPHVPPTRHRAYVLVCALSLNFSVPVAG
jgi:hypothetical protein